MKTVALLVLVASPTLASPPFASIRAELPDRTAGGAYTGALAWGDDRADARLERLGETWVLSLRPPARRLLDLAEAPEDSVLAGVDLADPVLVVSPARFTAALPDEARRHFGVDTLPLERGLNLFARVRIREGSPIRRFLAQQGLDLDGLLLQGVLLRDFDAEALKQAKADGKLKDALKKGSKLAVHLPRFRLKGLPAGFEQGHAYFFLTGEPGFGIGCTLTKDRQEFEAELALRRTETGTTEALLAASARGRWANAFGIDGFHVDGARLLVAMDSAQNASLGLRGDLVLGPKKVGIAGKVTVHAVTGAPTNVMLEGRLDEFSSADLVAIANATRGDRRPLDARALPGFRIADVHVRYAPLGGDARLGIESGIAVRGTLHALGRRLGAVDGALDRQTQPATIRLHGDVADFAAGPLALQDAAVAIHMGPTANPYFRIRGKSRMWMSRKAIDVDVARTRMSWAVDDTLGGAYAASYRYESSNGGLAWHGAVGFRNDFTRTLERDVSSRASAWAARTERDTRKTANDLAAAQRAVRNADHGIAAARATVQAERNAALNRLRAAEGEVERLDDALRARRAARERELQALRDTYAGRRTNASKKHRAWKKAVQATKDAPLHKKPKYKAREAKAFAAYQAATVSRDAALAAYEARERAPDEQVVALQAARGTAARTLDVARKSYAKITGGVTVDADPRVARRIAERATAAAALGAARAAVQRIGTAGARAARVTAYAAKHNGQLLMVDAARLEGGLGASLAGTGGTLHLQVRWMGERKDLRLRCNLADVARGLSERVWAALDPARTG